MITRNPVRSVGLFAALVVALTAAGPASASVGVTPAPVAPLKKCTEPTATQHFLDFGDDNFYALAPGGSFDRGNGWALANGATVASTTEFDGSKGNVLDLPSGSQATSPPMCITSDYPTARLYVRNIKGSEGVFFNVQYLVNGVWSDLKDTGQFHGDGTSWTLSNPMNIQPSSAAGWQQVRFTFFAGGSTSRFQVDEFWVDPRASR